MGKTPKQQQQHQIYDQNALGTEMSSKCDVVGKYAFIHFSLRLYSSLIGILDKYTELLDINHRTINKRKKKPQTLQHPYE